MTSSKRPILVPEQARVPSARELPWLALLFCRSMIGLGCRELRSARLLRWKLFQVIAILAGFTLEWPVMMASFALSLKLPGSRVIVDQGGGALIVIRRATVPVDGERLHGWLLCSLAALRPGQGYGRALGLQVVEVAEREGIPLRLQAATPWLAENLYAPIGFEIIPGHRTRYMPTMIRKAAMPVHRHPPA